MPGSGVRVFDMRNVVPQKSQTVKSALTALSERAAPQLGQLRAFIDYGKHLSLNIFIDKLFTELYNICFISVFKRGIAMPNSTDHKIVLLLLRHTGEVFKSYRFQ